MRGPGVFEEPEPQGAAATVGYVAAPEPLFVPPVLGGGDTLDDATVSFLLAQSLLERQELEEMEEVAKRREEKRLKRQAVEEAKTLRELLVQTERKMARVGRHVSAGSPVSADDLAAWQSWNAPNHTASSSSSYGKRRKRKKRKKRKLPKSSSSGCRRPCDHLRQLPAARFPVLMQRQVPTVHSFMLPVLFLDQVLDVAVVVLRQVLRLMVQKTVGFFRSCISSTIVGFPFRSAEADPHGPDFPADHRDSPIAVRFPVVDAPIVRVVQFLLCCRWRRSWRSHSCSSLRNRRPFFPHCRKLRIFRSCSSSTPSSSSPVVPQWQILMVQTVLQTTEFPQLLYVSGGRCPCCAGCALAVFLFVVFRHLGRYDQKDSCSGMYIAVIADNFTPRAVLFFPLVRPMMRCIMAGMDQ